MKKNSVCLFAFVSLLFLAATASLAQIIADERRPFDFGDKHYVTNGVISEMLIGRKNGADGESVIDFTNDPIYSNVRITATWPAYDATGGAIYWNYYGGVSKAGFTQDDSGPQAVELAYEHPLYVFPSIMFKNSDRQAAMIRVGESYFEKNPLGIAAVFFVAYTDKAFTKAGRMALEPLRERNGLSLDGTPIIRTAKELDSLLDAGLVAIEQPSLDEPYHTPFAVAKIVRYPESGGITPDAFLEYVKQSTGNPLDAEVHFVSMFECFKYGGKCF